MWTQDVGGVWDGVGDAIVEGETPFRPLPADGVGDADVVGVLAGGPRVFAMIGTVSVLECLSHRTLVELGDRYGLAQHEGRTRLELIEMLSRRKAVSATGLWHALDHQDRIAVLVHAAM